MPPHRLEKIIKGHVMQTQPFELYENATLDQTLFLELFGDEGNIKKATIGTRFEHLISIDVRTPTPNSKELNNAFHFFNNIAPICHYDELQTEWAAFLSEKTHSHN